MFLIVAYSSELVKFVEHCISMQLTEPRLIYHEAVMQSASSVCEWQNLNVFSATYSFLVATEGRDKTDGPKFFA